MTILTTKRLRLEPFADHHLDGLYALNSDPEVMRYITGKPQALEETKAGIAMIKERWLNTGFSWWSFIELATGEIIGAGCIQYLARDPANPHEIGWRLRQNKWGQGFASEAAQCMAAFAFDTLDVELLCAICDPENTKSTRVMRGLGMQYRGIEHWNDEDVAAYYLSRAEYELKKTVIPPIS
ncbi:GNAT family N-acetyltransferase [Solimicrobium silvestre]|uniref:Acetyltransferases including N-acetylases of ribosomal protein n=1 Tax=Solimicrobium silvestre TaxID=2099400 RepID=A0A2S9H3L9_9BURK|nr:GNAT family N-acetyltransferase [Solimicrobium silvestre]PRC94561.1 Acetyltransferases including N-acetylases of ribosomal protein [Solimicrobium silvestre]